MQPVAGRDGLGLLRLVFRAYGAAVAVMTAAVVVLEATGAGRTGAVPAGAAGAAVAVVGVAALVGQRAVGRGLDCTSDESLAKAYRARFFVRLALADTPVLVGFAGYVLTWDPLVFVVGLAVAAVGFARAAPSDGNLQRDQDALAAAGCGRPLVPALQALR